MVGGSEFYLWGLANVPHDTPLQKLLLMALGEAMRSNGICVDSAGTLAAWCCSTIPEVVLHLSQWRADGILGVTYDEDRDHIGLVFVEAYADAIWRDREASRQAAEARRAKKALRQGGAK